MAKLGLQLFTVKDEADRDLYGTLSKISEMGYEGVEFSAGIMKKTPAGKLKSYLDKIDLKLIGLILLNDELETQMDGILRYCKDCGCRNVIFPWIPEEFRTEEGYRSFACKMNDWGRIFQSRGIRFLYHIHGYEFEKLGTKNGMDILLENTDPRDVNLEIDVYWVEWGGVDSVTFMEKYGDRSPMIHFKDMKDKKTMHDVEVGAGVIDMKAIAVIGKRNNAEWFIVEQEKFDMPTLDSAKISLMNLRAISDAFED